MIHDIRHQNEFILFTLFFYVVREQQYIYMQICKKFVDKVSISIILLVSLSRTSEKNVASQKP